MHAKEPLTRKHQSSADAGRCIATSRGLSARSVGVQNLIETGLLYMGGRPFSGRSSQTMGLPRFNLPPGPSFILRQLFSPKVAGYGTFVTCIHVGGELLGIDFPLWTIVSCSMIALPAILYAQVEFRCWKNKRKATSLGAKLAPKIPSKWPWGLDLVATGVNVSRVGYIGEPSSCVHIVRGPNEVILGDAGVDWLAQRGQTIDVRTLGASRVSPSTSHHWAKHPDLDNRS